MNSEVAKMYGDKVRVRACGLCWQNDALLLVNHKGLTRSNFWAPPGGGLEFGQTIEASLRKEFLEETGLQIKVGKFMFGCEFINKPLHSIEVFYEVLNTGGELKIGNDPELQIITDVKYLSTEDILAIPKDQLHGIFRQVAEVGDLKKLTGFFSI